MKKIVLESQRKQSELKLYHDTCVRYRLREKKNKLLKHKRNSVYVTTGFVTSNRLIGPTYTKFNIVQFNIKVYSNARRQQTASIGHVTQKRKPLNICYAKPGLGKAIIHETRDMVPK